MAGNWVEKKVLQKAEHSAGRLAFHLAALMVVQKASQWAGPLVAQKVFPMVARSVDSMVFRWVVNLAGR